MERASATLRLVNRGTHTEWWCTVHLCVCLFLCVSVWRSITQRKLQSCRYTPALTTNMQLRWGNLLKTLTRKNNNSWQISSTNTSVYASHLHAHIQTPSFHAKTNMSYSHHSKTHIIGFLSGHYGPFFPIGFSISQVAVALSPDLHIRGDS